MCDEGAKIEQAMWMMGRRRVLHDESFGLIRSTLSQESHSSKCLERPGRTIGGGVSSLTRGVSFQGEKGDAM